jgi:uncharacterized membrane protein YbaN (DUF454 family)
VFKTIHRGLWLVMGIFFLFLGVIGVLLPVLPGFVFFILALLSFMRCSKRFNAWMEKQPWFARFRKRLRNLRSPWLSLR